MESEVIDLKIDMSPAELVKFVTDGQFPESARETLVGGILAMCDSPEMSKAIMSKVESEVRSVLNEALRIKSDGYYGNKVSLQGWASEIMLAELTNKVKELDIKSIMREMIATEVKKQFDEALRANVRSTIESEYKVLLKGRVDAYDIEHLVETRVKKALAGILAQ